MIEPEYTPNNTPWLARMLAPTSAFEIVDHKHGYVIHKDPIQNKGEADPHQLFVYKVLGNRNVATGSLHCAAWECEMSGERGEMHLLPDTVSDWLGQQI